jgi:hypothetical protein
VKYRTYLGCIIASQDGVTWMAIANDFTQDDADRIVAALNDRAALETLRGDLEKR